MLSEIPPPAEFAESVPADAPPTVPSRTQRKWWWLLATVVVLGVGILLIAFPKAHGVVLGALYLPVALMLLGLMLRGVAFDFRVKARDEHQLLWNRLFITGSILASLAQGWMLGRFVTGFAEGLWPQVFAGLIALSLIAAYLLLGAGWLIIKTEGSLQRRAVDWAKSVWPVVVIGIGLISVATPIVSPEVRERWFSMPGFIALLPIPLVTLGLLSKETAALFPAYALALELTLLRFGAASAATSRAWRIAYGVGTVAALAAFLG